jgi:predicted CopG family antitoxin
MKTVTFDDEAYDLLRSAKLTPGESFSKVVKRVLGQKQGWDRVFGAWADLTDEEVAAMRQRSIDAFGWTGDKKW